MTEGEGVFFNIKMTPYIIFDYTYYLNLKIKSDEKSYLLFHQRRRGHFTTLKFDPICNDVLY